MKVDNFMAPYFGWRSELWLAPPSSQAVIPLDTLREYIAYSRSHCRPRLSEDAAAALVDGYVEMRRLGVSRKVCTYPIPLPFFVRNL